MSSTSAPDLGRNRLLAALPGEDLERLRRDLRVERTEFKRVLHEPGQVVDTVYFPLETVNSMLSETPDGDQIEVATIGHEGLVGLAAFLEADADPARHVCQVPGHAASLSASILRRETERGGPLARVLNRYAMALVTMVAQGSACNRLHEVNERCARWLLLTHDRVGSDRFPLTHEFLAQMLGVRRASVSLAMGALAQADLVAYRRGIIEVWDRTGLEAASCDCYRIIRREFDRLLA